MKDLSLHILDIAQNSVKAGAKSITIEVNETDGMLSIRISDDGSGMNEEALNKAEDPFYTTRTTRKVGLGIPLLKDAAEQAGGSFSIKSQPGRGTAVEASFMTGSIDRKPLGSLGETLAALLLSDKNMDCTVIISSRKGEFNLSLKEIRGKIGEADIDNFEILNWLSEYLDEGVRTTLGGVLNEIHS
jgi:anti-sigma regulatory factor (Ser/Thr protein kinase)